MTHADDIYSDYEYTFITGHVPVQTVRRWQEPEDDWNALKSYKHGNLISIDRGCAMGHVKDIATGAIFLRLDDMREMPVSFDGLFDSV